MACVINYKRRQCSNGWFVAQNLLHGALHVACLILLISFLYLHSSWSGYQPICWVGLQLVKEIWVLIQSILCAAAKSKYVILHVKDIFNHHSDCTICIYVNAKYHWICSLCNINSYCLLILIPIAITLYVCTHVESTYIHPHIHTLNLSAVICIPS